MEVKRTFDLLDRYCELFNNKPDALCFRHEGQWKKFSSKEYCEYSENICLGLLSWGLEKGDKVVSVSSNRPEWNFFDMGMAMAGIVHVPVFTSLSNEEYEFVINDSGAKMILISDQKLYNCLSPFIKSARNDIKIVTFDRIEGAVHWMDLIETGRRSGIEIREKASAVKQSVREEDVATLIYTSGTTGRPKGVMLSHRNLVTNFISASSVFRLKPDDKYLSILPLCHVGGRMGNYQTQYSGSTIYYAENMGTIAANMAEIRPDGFDAVPRIIEKFYDVIISKGKALKGFKKWVFFRAVDHGLRYEPFGANGLVYDLLLGVYRKLVFSKWIKALGGNVRIAGCGGASLQPRLERIFWAAGIKVINMYGLTETSPIITINRTQRGDVRLGSVGSTIEGVSIKIADDGEILCKGPNVMTGYYNDPGLTAAAFDSEGWFRTGDIGRLEEGKFLYVTDRKKEIFKLSNGKFIAPQVIENILKESPAIDQVMVMGENKKFPAAIISPDFKFLASWKKTGNAECLSNDDIIVNKEIVRFISEELDRLNSRLNPYEKITRFRLVKDEWGPASGELSPTLKLRREFISAKYRNQIDSIYPRDKSTI